MKRVLFALLVVLCLAGCAPAVDFDDVVPYPSGCTRLGLELDACRALVAEATARMELSTAEVERVDLLSEDRCGDDRRTWCTRTLPFAGGVRFTLLDGSVRWTSIACPLGDGPPPAWCSR